jgi:hypothetical protein
MSQSLSFAATNLRAALTDSEQDSNHCSIRRSMTRRWAHILSAWECHKNGVTGSALFM